MSIDYRPFLASNRHNYKKNCHVRDAPIMPYSSASSQSCKQKSRKTKERICTTVDFLNPHVTGATTFLRFSLSSITSWDIIRNHEYKSDFWQIVIEPVAERIIIFSAEWNMLLKHLSNILYVWYVLAVFHPSAASHQNPSTIIVLHELSDISNGSIIWVCNTFELMLWNA